LTHPVSRSQLKLGVRQSAEWTHQRENIMMRELQRSLLVVAVVLVASPALAGPGPSREFAGAPPGTTFSLLAGVCAFPVSITIVVNDEYSLTFNPDASGATRQLWSGRFVAAFTNDDSGLSVIRNVSGPGEYVFYSDNSVDFTGNGVWAILFVPGQRGPETPGALFVNQGKIVLHTDSDEFHQTVVAQVGTQEDLCAVLE